MKKRTVILSGIVAIVVAVGAGAGATYVSGQYNNYELKQEKVIIELGEKLNKEPSYYVKSNDKAVAGTELDFSHVESGKVGTYKATAAYKDNKLSFEVTVVDTTAPKVALTEDGAYRMVAGESITAEQIVGFMDDLSGISEVKFKQAEKKIENETDLLKAAAIAYDTEGDYTNTLIVSDNNGNVTEKEIKIHVIENYANHVSGFHDWTIEQGAQIDFTVGIEKDERIVSVQADTESIDINTPGNYELPYSIAGDDNETVIERTVSVRIVDSSTAQEMANSGDMVYISGNLLKEKEVYTAKSEGTDSGRSSSGTEGSSGNRTGNNSGSSSSSGAGNNTGSSSSSGTQDFLDTLTPGQSWDLGEVTSRGEIPEGGWSEGYDPIIITP